jgi:protein phosphatase
LVRAEDALERSRSGNVYLVADGVGGGSRGEKASQYAVQKVLYEYYQWGDAEPAKRLVTAIQAANADIYAFSEDHESEMMGTTLVAIAARVSQATIASVGDSRVYLIRSKKAQQITHDHSLVQKLVDNGQLTLEKQKIFRGRTSFYAASAPKIPWM